jgi:serine/threonine protein phosphatase PrpC
MKVKIFGRQLSPGGGRLIIASDGVWDQLTSERAAKVCRGERHPEIAAKNIVKVC